MAAQLNLLRCPAVELPQTLYRVQYKDTHTDFIFSEEDARKCFLRAKDQAAFRDEATFDLRQFKTAVMRNINWASRTPSPFINLFSNLHHAGNWCLQRVEKKHEDGIIMSIDPVKLVEQGVWLAKLSTVCEHLAIDLKATKACGDQDAYLVLHRIPATAILGCSLVSEFTTIQDVIGVEESGGGMAGSPLITQVHSANTANQEAIHNGNGQDNGHVHLNQLMIQNPTEGTGLLSDQHATESEPEDDYMSDGTGSDESKQDEDMSATDFSERDGDMSDDDMGDDGSDATTPEHGYTMHEIDGATTTDAEVSNAGRPTAAGGTRDSASVAESDSEPDQQLGPDEDDEEADLLDVIDFCSKKGFFGKEGA